MLLDCSTEVSWCTDHNANNKNSFWWTFVKTMRLDCQKGPHKFDTFYYFFISRFKKNKQKKLFTVCVFKVFESFIKVSWSIKFKRNWPSSDALFAWAIKQHYPMIFIFHFSKGRFDRKYIFKCFSWTSWHSQYINCHPKTSIIFHFKDTASGYAHSTIVWRYYQSFWPSAQ